MGVGGPPRSSRASHVISSTSLSARGTDPGADRARRSATTGRRRSSRARESSAIPRSAEKALATNAISSSVNPSTWISTRPPGGVPTAFFRVAWPSVADTTQALTSALCAALISARSIWSPDSRTYSAASMTRIRFGELISPRRASSGWPSHARSAPIWASSRRRLSITASTSTSPEASAASITVLTSALLPTPESPVTTTRLAAPIASRSSLSDAGRDRVSDPRWCP
jgi:hypothetical protein